MRQPEPGEITSPRIARIRSASEPHFRVARRCVHRSVAITHQDGRRMQRAVRSIVREYTAADSPVAPVTKSVSLIAVMPPPRRRSSARRTRTRRADALTGLDLARVERVAVVDEVVAGQRVAVSRDVVSPEACARELHQARQDVPAPHADVVRDDPVHVGGAPNLRRAPSDQPRDAQSGNTTQRSRRAGRQRPSSSLWLQSLRRAVGCARHPARRAPRTQRRKCN